MIAAEPVGRGNAGRDRRSLVTRARNGQVTTERPRVNRRDRAGRAPRSAAVTAWESGAITLTSARWRRPPPGGRAPRGCGSIRLRMCDGADGTRPPVASTTSAATAGPSPPHILDRLRSRVGELGGHPHRGASVGNGDDRRREPAAVDHRAVDRRILAAVSEIDRLDSPAASRTRCPERSRRSPRSCCFTRYAMTITEGCTRSSSAVAWRDAREFHLGARGACSGRPMEAPRGRTRCVRT